MNVLKHCTSKLQLYRTQGTSKGFCHRGLLTVCEVQKNKNCETILLKQNGVTAFVNLFYLSF